MEKLGANLDDVSATGDQRQNDPQESRHLSIQRCIQTLAHACECRDTTCCLPSCLKMKLVVQHAMSCERKTNGDCPICKQLIALCCYHAKRCQEENCRVPFCADIKHKLTLQRLQQQHIEPMSQMMPLVPNCIMQETQCWDNIPYGQQGMQMQQHHPPQPAMGIRQTSWPSGMQNAVGNQIAPMGPPPPLGLPNAAAGPSMTIPNQALQQLLQTLRAPSSAQQQQHVLQILKSNPHLMAVFIKQRSAKQQQQQLIKQMQQMQLNDNDEDLE